MRATVLALCLAPIATAACRSAAPSTPVAPAQAQVEPRARFKDLMQRWEKARTELHADVERRMNEESTGGDTAQKPAAVPLSNAHPELKAMYLEFEALAPEVPEALQFCVAISCDPLLALWNFPLELGPETLCKTVRAAPGTDSVERCLWRLWNGSEPDALQRGPYLDALSELGDVPAGSLARGWSRLAQTVRDNGIGATDSMSHDPRPALDALAAIESEYPGTAVGRHAQALVRIAGAYPRAAMAPALELISIDRQPLNLSKSRGRCALVLFWDPADRLTPEVLDRIPDLGKRIDLIGIQVGGEAADVARLLESYQAPWRTAVIAGSSDPLLQEWGVRALPASFLVDQEGRVRAIDLFGEALGWNVKALVEHTYPDPSAR